MIPTVLFFSVICSEEQVCCFWILSYVPNIAVSILSGLGRTDTHPESCLYLSFHGHGPYLFSSDIRGCPGLSPMKNTCLFTNGNKASMCEGSPRLFKSLYSQADSDLKQKRN